MQFVFRKFPGGEAPPPGPGEIYVKIDSSRAEDGQGAAGRVLKDGLAVLPRGAEPTERIVVDTAALHPTFDDMLAASFVQELVEGRPLPAGCQAFADYAAVLRQGLRPGNFPPEDSLEGIFLAIRNAAGKDADLTNPATGERFRKDWGRLADCILKAAAKGVNPVTESPCAGRPEFMQERAFLLRDRGVYRTDVERGERWLVRLQDGPDQASGLFLRKPTSLLFPYWSRTDGDAPAGGAYLFLAVHWGGGGWMISTDPVQRLPISALAKSLQKAEATRAPEHAAKDPWYDGRRPEHGGTLVAAPKGGTKLAEPEVLRVVKKWAHAKAAVRSRRWLQFAGAAAILLALGGLVWSAMKTPDSNHKKSSQSGDQIDDRRANPIVIKNGSRIPDYKSDWGSKWLSIGPNSTDNSRELLVSFEPPYDFPHSARMWVTLTVLKGDDLPVGGVQATLNVNGGESIIKPLPVPGATAETKTMVFEAADVAFRAKDNSITIAVNTSADNKDRDVSCQVEWHPKADLYVLAVGVSDYADANQNLGLPRDDAKALVKALMGQKKHFFSRVEPRTLIDQEASREAILKGMTWLKDNKPRPIDMVVVLLAGHGFLTEGGHFVFAPYDFDFNDKDLRCLMDVEFMNKLAGLPCNVLLLLDCCHSGAFIEIGALEVPKGMLVFAAARSDEKAGGTVAWGHGALSLAVLEAIQNKYLYPADPQKPTDAPFSLSTRLHHGEITWENLRTYVTARVSYLTSLTGKQQAAQIKPSRDLAADQIPIALQSPARK